MNYNNRMTRIGLLSDTHGSINEKIIDFFKDCNEVWHAGDIGTLSVTDRLAKHFNVRAVYGNIDGQDVRTVFPLHQKFICEDVNVWMTHIGGYPPKYYPEIRRELEKNSYGLFIAGHSHILKVIYDKQNNLLHINPGAAGNLGIHNVITAIRFCIDKKDIKELDILEIPRNKEKHSF